ncbi:MAG: hypothetical protein WCA78_14325 [Rhizomicrobium sp.]
MALISELNGTISDVLRIPLPTVAMYSRRLREAGKLSEKGRGRGAAHATPLDAARLLIALVVDLGPARSTEVVTDFGGLQLSDALEIEPSRAPVAKNVIESVSIRLFGAYELPEEHTFEEAFAAIIAGFANERFALAWTAATRAIPGLNNTIQQFIAPDCSVVVMDTSLQASIHLNGNRYHYASEAMRRLLRSTSWQDHERMFEEFERGVVSKYRRGINSTRSIPFEELRKIAAVVNGGEIDLKALLERHRAAELDARTQANSSEAQTQ